MTHNDRLVVTAYTGLLMTSEEAFVEFASKALKRRVTRLDMTSDGFWEELRNKVRPKFLAMCEKDCVWVKPNSITRKALKEGDKLANDPNAKRAKSVDELKSALKDE